MGEFYIKNHSGEPIRLLTDKDLAKAPATQQINLYVDPINGNDANDGSESSKLKTMTKALSMFPKNLGDFTHHIYVTDPPQDPYEPPYYTPIVESLTVEGFKYGTIRVHQFSALNGYILFVNNAASFTFRIEVYHIDGRNLSSWHKVGLGTVAAMGDGTLEFGSDQCEVYGPNGTNQFDCIWAKGSSDQSLVIKGSTFFCIDPANAILKGASFENCRLEFSKFYNTTSTTSNSNLFLKKVTGYCSGACGWAPSFEESTKFRYVIDSGYNGASFPTGNISATYCTNLYIKGVPAYSSDPQMTFNATFTNCTGTLAFGSSTKPHTGTLSLTDCNFVCETSLYINNKITMKRSSLVGPSITIAGSSLNPALELQYSHMRLSGLTISGAVVGISMSYGSTIFTSTKNISASGSAANILTGSRAYDTTQQNAWRY